MWVAQQSRSLGAAEKAIEAAVEGWEPVLKEQLRLAIGSGESATGQQKRQAIAENSEPVGAQQKRLAIAEEKKRRTGDKGAV